MPAYRAILFDLDGTLTPVKDCNETCEFVISSIKSSDVFSTQRGSWRLKPQYSIRVLRKEPETISFHRE